IIQRQEKKFDDTQSDYKKAIAKLGQLIAATKRNADLVAQYPRAMVDVPGVDWDPSRSAPCYNDRFDEIQKIVSKLDDMIIEGETARAKSAQLKGIALDSDQKIDSGKNARLIKGKSQTVTPGFSVDHRYRDSDVTGLKEEKPLNTESATSTKQLPLKRMKDEPNALLIDDILQNRSIP
ncbi:MAG: hypothetical protein ACXWQO_06610, partial [Bdellovibrionota bacterium]